MRPLVALTCERSSDPGRERVFKAGHAFDFLLCTYSALLRQAGCLPVLLPVGSERAEARDLLRRVDGLLLSGGCDLDPALWGEDELEPGGHVLPIGEDERARAAWEHLLVEEALALELPLLGICRGLQQLNVSLGGSLWQDLERQLGRGGHPGGEDPFTRVHALTCLKPEDPLAPWLAGARVTSTHHQGLRRLAPRLEVLATAEGEAEVVEAVRFRGPSFALGVQWHPERLPDDPLTQALLESFRTAMLARRMEP